MPSAARGFSRLSAWPGVVRATQLACVPGICMADRQVSSAGKDWSSVKLVGLRKEGLMARKYMTPRTMTVSGVLSMTMVSVVRVLQSRVAQAQFTCMVRPSVVARL